MVATRILSPLFANATNKTNNMNKIYESSADMRAADAKAQTPDERAAWRASVMNSFDLMVDRNEKLAKENKEVKTKFDNLSTRVKPMADDFSHHLRFLLGHTIKIDELCAEVCSHPFGPNEDYSKRPPAEPNARVALEHLAKAVREALRKAEEQLPVVENTDYPTREVSAKEEFERLQPMVAAFAKIAAMPRSFDNDKQ